MHRGYLTSGEAAQHIGLSKVTLLRATKRGEIKPALRTPGGCFRFLPAEVEAFASRLRDCCRPSSEPEARVS